MFRGNLFSLEFTFTEVVKFFFHGRGRKNSFENLFLQKGLKFSFSRTNFCNFCLTSAKARKPHPAKISSIKVAQVYYRKQVLSEREHFSGKTICCFFYVGAYEQIRRSGFVSLPRRTTLNKYTGFKTIGTGFNPV